MTTAQILHVAVFGASGNIGRLVVEQLLAAGHTVTAFVRNPATLTVAHPNVRVVEGELDDASGVARAITGADAVISALGPILRRGATGTPVNDGTRNIVKAMHASGVRRYTALGTPAVADQRRPADAQGQGPAAHAAPCVPERPRRARRHDERRHELRTRLDIARITSPNDKPARGRFLGRDKVGSGMTRADIAAFLVNHLSDDTYLQAAPAISN